MFSYFTFSCPLSFFQESSQINNENPSTSNEEEGDIDITEIGASGFDLPIERVVIIFTYLYVFLNKQFLLFLYSLTK